MNPVHTTMLQQIGGELLPISGGRWIGVDDDTIRLPAGGGYHVIVHLDRGRDLYDVQRVFRRSGVHHDHGSIRGVYCDRLAAVAYRASCYHDTEPFGEREGQLL